MLAGCGPPAGQLRLAPPPRPAAGSSEATAAAAALEASVAANAALAGQMRAMQEQVAALTAAIGRGPLPPPGPVPPLVPAPLVVPGTEAFVPAGAPVAAALSAAEVLDGLVGGW